MTSLMAHEDILKSTALDRVRKELDVVFEQVRAVLEATVEDRAAAQNFEDIASRLRQVADVLEIAEYRPTSALVKEMATLAQAMARGQVVNHEASCEVLMRAVLQIPGYLDFVREGHRDVPQVLQPLIVELREARRGPILPEGALFFPSEMPKEVPVADKPKDNDETLQIYARRVRPRFQRQILAVFRLHDVPRALDRLARILHRLWALSEGVSARRLWWVATAWIRAAKTTNGVELPDIKLLAQLEHRLKEVAGQGEAGLDSQRSDEVVRAMLWHIARAAPNSTLLVSVRKAFGLDDAIPTTEEVAGARDSLRGTGPGLLVSVAQAVHEELAGIKDTLDVFVHAEQRDITILSPLVDRLGHIAETFGLLGFDKAGDLARCERDALAAMISGDDPINDAALMNLAGMMINIESVVNAYLSARSNVLPQENNEEALAQREFEAIEAAVLHEALTDLRKVKEALLEYLSVSHETKTLEGVAEILNRIGGALGMLGEDRAESVMQSLSRYVAERLCVGGRPEGVELEDLADAVTGTEFYIAALEGGYGQSDSLLEQVANRVARLWPAVQPAAPVDAAALPYPVFEDESDPEILKVFLEEADEELERIGSLLPGWLSAPDDAESLAVLRRAFHTLKGSGRMAGAKLLGEFAWAVENLLNRVIDRTVEVGDTILAAMREVGEALPALVGQLTGGPAPETDIGALIDRLYGLARPDAIVEPVPAAASETAEGAGSVPRLDPVLFEIFCNETKQHLATLESCIDHEPASEVGGIAMDEMLLRALHTLNGSALAAGIHEIADVAGAFEHYLKHADETGIRRIPQSAATLLSELVGYVHEVLTRIAEPGAALPSPDTLRARIGTLSGTAISSAAAPPVVYRELVEVFLDEGGELLEACDEAIQRWREVPAEHAALDAFLRQLHTLKGSARTAGLAGIGELCHALESLAGTAASGWIEADPPLFAAVHQTIDRLSGMLQQVRMGEASPEATDLVWLLNGLRSGSGFDGQERAPTLSSSTPEPTDQSVGLLGAPVITEAKEAFIPEVSTSVSAEAIPESEPSPLALVAEAPAVVDVPVAPPSVETVPTQFSPDGRESVRVASDLLNRIASDAGEVGVCQARMEQQVRDIGGNLGELARTVTRLREQLRRLEIETEAQVLANVAREQAETARQTAGFDPLEMDRYSSIQQLSRALAESVGDLSGIQQLLTGQVREVESVLAQEVRLSSDLQESLMRTRMVPLGNLVGRFRRVVRQAAQDLGREAQLVLSGEDVEIDRRVLDGMIGPIEHMLRNAVAHGIEPPAVRQEMGKSAAGMVTLSMSREGSEILLEVADDGAGIDFGAVLDKARREGRIAEDARPDEASLLRLILESGFTTVGEVSQVAGRGVGMDVVHSEVRRLGGMLGIDTRRGEGTRFTVRLPITLAVTRVLIAHVGNEIYAIPFAAIEGVTRIRSDDQASIYEFDGEQYAIIMLNDLVGAAQTQMPPDSYPLLLTRVDARRIALRVDGLVTNREAMIKPLGHWLAPISGFYGGTQLGDGRVALVVDIPALVRRGGMRSAVAPTAAGEAAELPLILVVDDSLTIRRVTSRLLERAGYRVAIARDGIEALERMDEHIPDLVLLDIEMPRMDGYELATNMRNDSRLKHVPIVMITSRTGEKHRARALSIGVNEYLGKPWQEEKLLRTIHEQVAIGSVTGGR